MRVALVTEGTYPINAGGVSAWCDQLIRGMPDVGFDVVALSGSGRERISYEPPCNMRSLTRFGLWGTPRSARLTRPDVESFSEIYEAFLESILRDGPAATVRFEASVRALRGLAQAGRLTAAMRSQASVDVFLSVWERTGPVGSGIDPITLAEVLAITDLMEHYLRPLRLPALDADIVHATANGSSTLVGLATKWERATPVVVSEHGVYLRERMLSIREAEGTAAHRAMMIRFFVRLTELGYRAADAVLPVSNFNARWALRNGARAGAVRTIHNGVDPATLPVIEQEPAVPTLVFVGRIDPLKDLETLIRAFALVRRRLPAARLRMFGPVPSGNEEYAARCRRLVADLGLVDAATFEGPVSPARRAFEAGHAVVLSSVSEGLPLTIIEAAMAGRATIGTDVGGMAEAIGEGGLVVPTGDHHQLAAACRRVLLDDSLRHRLAAAGRIRALEHFTLARMLDDFDGLYRQFTHRRVVVPGARSAPVPALVGAR